MKRNWNRSRHLPIATLFQSFPAARPEFGRWAKIGHLNEGLYFSQEQKYLLSFSSRSVKLNPTGDNSLPHVVPSAVRNAETWRRLLRLIEKASIKALQTHPHTDIHDLRFSETYGPWSRMYWEAVHFYVEIERKVQNIYHKYIYPSLCTRWRNPQARV